MWAKIITIKITKYLNYFSLCALNLFNTQVELNHNLSWITWNKWTFPQHSNLLRCTCIWRSESSFLKRCKGITECSHATSRIFQVYGRISDRVWGKTNQNVTLLFNKYPDLRHWFLCTTACSWESIRQRFIPTRPGKAHKLWEIKIAKNMKSLEIPISICVHFSLSWISLDQNSFCRDSQNDSWQMNAITCCEQLYLPQRIK